jgi:O-antigen/teichoic acid export membrane protein
MRKNIVYNILLSLSNILFPLISFPYAARILGPNGIGEAQFIFSYAQYFALFAALGIPVYGIKEIAKANNDLVATKSTFFSLSALFFITSIIASALYLASILLIPYFKPLLNIYIITGILVLFSFTYTDWYYSGKGAFKTITIRSVIVKAMALLLLYVFVKTPSDLYNYLGVLIFTILGNQVYSFILICYENKGIPYQLEFSKHIKPLLFIFGATAASSMYTILDTVLLGFLSNATAVGYYTAAIKFIKLILPFVTSVGAVFIPVLSKNFAEKDYASVQKNLNASFYFIVALTIPLTIGSILIAPEIIAIFSGEKFENSILPMQIMSILPIIIGFGHLFAFQILIPSDKSKEVFVAMIIGLIISVGLNFILTPIYQEVGASIICIITEITVTLLYFYYTNKLFSFRYPWKFLLQSLIACTVFIPISIACKAVTQDLYIYTCLCIISCAAVYIVIQLFIFKNTFLTSYFRTPKTIGDA